MRIGVRIQTGVTIIILFFTLFNIYLIFGIDEIADHSKNMYEYTFKSSNAVLKADFYIQSIQNTLKDVVLAKDVDEIEKYERTIKDLNQKVLGQFAIVKTQFVGDPLLVNEAYNAYKSWKETRNKVFDLMLSFKTSNRLKAAELIQNEGADKVENITASMDALDNLIQQKALIFHENVTKVSDVMVVFIWGLLVLILIFAIIIFGIIIKSVVLPMGKLVKAAGKIAKGSFNVEVDVEQKGEIGELATSFREMIKNLRKSVKIAETVAEGKVEKALKEAERIGNGELDSSIREMIASIQIGVQLTRQITQGDLSMINELKKRKSTHDIESVLREMVVVLHKIMTDIKINADNIAKASEEMSENSQQISEGASEQAASTEQISTAMEQMHANIQQNTDNARQTERIALNASQRIADNNRSTSILVSAIKEIVEKISIIGEIASQTNILALNAAVEAARAGIHGKGFAVVASEIKELAERSKIAAAEINELSKSGVELAENTGKELEAVVPEIEKTAQLVQEIAMASIEQAAGANQVNNAIQQLNDITQQNAASSEEMATSAEEFASQAEQLKDLISYFKIKG